MKIYPALNRQHILTLSSMLIPRITSRIVYALRFQPGTSSTLSTLSEVIFSLHSCTESICTWLMSLSTISPMLLYRNQGFLLTWSVFGFAFPVSLSAFEPGSDYYVSFVQSFVVQRLERNMYSSTLQLLLCRRTISSRVGMRLCKP